MKLFFALCFVAVALFGVTRGAVVKSASRRIRATALGKCPLSVPLEDCEEFAKNQFKNSCVGYQLNDRDISWLSCGVLLCGEFWQESEGNLSLPYPRCCPKCEFYETA